MQQCISDSGLNEMTITVAIQQLNELTTVNTHSRKTCSYLVDRVRPIEWQVAEAPNSDIVTSTQKYLG